MGAAASSRCLSSTARASIRSMPPARSRPGSPRRRRCSTREIKRVGDKHFDTAAARGTLAVGYMRAGRDADAMREFRAAIPILMAASRENADDDDTHRDRGAQAAAAERRRGLYRLLAKAPPEAGNDVAVETFALADAIRGRSVQQALASSSARMVAKDPALAELVRKEQDLGQADQRPARCAQQCAGAALERARREGRQGDQCRDRQAARRTRQGAAGDRPPLSRPMPI